MILFRSWVAKQVPGNCSYFSWLSHNLWPENWNNDIEIRCWMRKLFRYGKVNYIETCHLVKFHGIYTLIEIIGLSLNWWLLLYIIIISVYFNEASERINAMYWCATLVMYNYRWLVEHVITRGSNLGVQSTVIIVTISLFVNRNEYIIITTNSISLFTQHYK